MNKIRFRGKDPMTGEWVYGLYLPRNNANPMGYNTWDNIMVWNFMDWGIADYDEVRVLSKSVTQYVGMIDINKKDIFEKDIIKFTYGTTSGIGVVCFDRGAFYIEGLGGSYYLSEFDSDDTLEVVGNTIDNMEMVASWYYEKKKE